ncbi:MAG TPA: histidine--tRNA ligase [bacterium]|nr:histidine--tRNA ligase [bacterium]HPT29350.1 histidine--tRNA ligase [bacterium]
MPRPKKNINSKKPMLVKTGEAKEKTIGVGRLLGTKDVGAGEYKYWQSILTKVREISNLYSFQRTDTPIMENWGLFKKSPRLKSLYFWPLSKTDKAALRPDLTHGLARYFLDQNLLESPQPVKLFNLGPVFRNETRVQTGRYRQFNQFNFEIFNEAKPIGEALLITLACQIFKELQIDVQVQINSLGNFDCQKEFLHKFVKFYRDRGKKIKLCPECRKNLTRNPLALLTCHEPVCVEARKEAPQITNYLSEESSQMFTRVLEYLDELNINYNFDPYLVKELNYYTDTIFEIWPINEKGEIDGRQSLARGGRYNHLFEQIGGKSLPAVGFAGGLERTVYKLKEKNLIFKKEDTNIVFLAQVSDSARLRAMTMFTELSKAGFQVRQAFTVDNLKEQLEEAKRLNAKIILVLGKKEISSETILFRDVEVGVQEVITQKDLRERLNKKFNQKIK